MQSAKENKKISKKKSSLPIRGKTKNKLFRYIFFISLPLTVILLATVFYYSKNIFLYSLRNHEKVTESSKLLKLAEEAYKEGYLENSATAYYNYLKTAPSKVNQILTYKRLFEINVLKGDIPRALSVLKDQEQLTPNDPFISINRLKLFLRTENLTEAKAEITKSRNKLKKSPEFMDLTATYYMKKEDYETALKELLKIPQRKRGYFINKKVVHCYIKINQISRALAYLHKMEPLVRTFDNKAAKGEFFLLKSAAKLLKGESEKITEDLRPSLLEPDLRPIGYKLILFSYILQDREAELTDFLSNKEVFTICENNPKLLASIGNYYVYRKKYSSAQFYYETIYEKRDYTKQELLALSDIYYHLQDFKNAEKTLRKLNSRYSYISKDYFKNLALLRLKQDDFSGAVHYLTQGSKEYEEESDFYLRLAYINGENGFQNAAITHLKEGMRISKLLQNGTYDQTFDLLKLKYSGNGSSKDLTELELLVMRNHSEASVLTYFRLIRFYLANNRLFDAKRELQTAENLPLSKEQKREYYGYRFIYALQNGNLEEYNEIKKILEKEKEADPLYLAIIQLIDGNYDIALDSLLNLERKIEETDKSKLERILYLKSVIHYYKKDYPASYQSLYSLFSLNPHHKKASYLQNILNSLTQTTF